MESLLVGVQESKPRPCIAGELGFGADNLSPSSVFLHDALYSLPRLIEGDTVESVILDDLVECTKGNGADGSRVSSLRGLREFSCQLS
jgi:hypothetical protein